MVRMRSWTDLVATMLNLPTITLNMKLWKAQWQKIKCRHELGRSVIKALNKITTYFHLYFNHISILKAPTQPTTVGGRESSSSRYEFKGVVPKCQFMHFWYMGSVTKALLLQSEILDFPFKNINPQTYMTLMKPTMGLSLGWENWAISALKIFIWFRTKLVVYSLLHQP